MTSKLSECFLPPLFQTNRISRRINKLSENLTSLSIFTLKIKQFLWTNHTLPSLFWAALINSVNISYEKFTHLNRTASSSTVSQAFKSPKLSSLKAEMFSFHSKYFVYRELKRAPQKWSFCFKCQDTGTVRILGNILYLVKMWSCCALNLCSSLRRNSMGWFFEF